MLRACCCPLSTRLLRKQRTTCCCVVVSACVPMGYVLCSKTAILPIQKHVFRLPKCVFLSCKKGISVKLRICCCQQMCRCCLVKQYIKTREPSAYCKFISLVLSCCSVLFGHHPRAGPALGILSIARVKCEVRTHNFLVSCQKYQKNELYLYL